MGGSGIPENSSTPRKGKSWQKKKGESSTKKSREENFSFVWYYIILFRTFRRKFTFKGGLNRKVVPDGDGIETTETFRCHLHLERNVIQYTAKNLCHLSGNIKWGKDAQNLMLVYT